MTKTFVADEILTASDVNQYLVNDLYKITPTSVAGTGVSIGSNGDVNFTAASTVSLNGIFSSTYRNYRVIINCTSSVSGQPRVRLRASGTDVTTANSYIGERFYTSGATVSSGTGTLDYWETNLLNNTSHDVTFELSGPALASVTTAKVTSYCYGGTAAQFYAGLRQTGTTARDGLTFYPTSGTVTGVIQVYGYA